MATETCYCCGGSGIVDEGTPNERECPFCFGTGYVETNDEEENS